MITQKQVDEILFRKDEDIIENPNLERNFIVTKNIRIWRIKSYGKTVALFGISNNIDTRSVLEKLPYAERLVEELR